MISATATETTYNCSLISGDVSGAGLRLLENKRALSIVEDDVATIFSELEHINSGQDVLRLLGSSMIVVIMLPVTRAPSDSMVIAE